jgi:hypothetical protein
MASQNAMRVIDIDVSHFFFIIVTHMLKSTCVFVIMGYFTASPMELGLYKNM